MIKQIVGTVRYALGVLWLGPRTQIRHRGVLAYGGIGRAGLMLAVFGLAVPVLLTAALVNGFGLEAFSLIWTNTLQELVPRERLGRVASIDLLGSFALLPVGYGLAGWATAWLGPAPVFLIGGSGAAACALLALLHPRIRGLD